MLTKIKEWFKATGLTNFGYAAGAIASFILIGGKLGAFVAGGCVGLFIYFNFSKIKELINGIK